MKLSHERLLLKVLVSLGIRKVDAEVYLFLATEGPKKGRDIADALKMYKQQLYRSLKNLQEKGLVKASLERPARFSAVSFENVLDSFKEAKLEETKFIEEKKDELLSRWRSIVGERLDKLDRDKRAKHES